MSMSKESGNQFLHERNPDFHNPGPVELAVSQAGARGEHVPNEPADIGSVAVASAEIPETPGVGVEQIESDRKKNTGENLRLLKNRFGERFVKGDRMEGGGYTGGAARELLAGFMDRPGFADELKRLIPGKRGALTLLKDNHAYIQATLDQHYKDDPGYEDQPAQDPYELARSVGYELTGPFESTGEFVPLDKQDFRPGERLCTFNSPVERLRGYHILWLRHAEVADTLPADELTADNLSEAWKTYLKTVGRYDQGSDSYDLDGLSPARDDPYGTSSMSVQISRQGTHVSIKNRYNHTVGNPDNTLDSDLDNVVYGLRRAVYHRVGREDLMNKTGVALAEGYITDNDGGIHPYDYEENNVYYGNYEYIENGVVTTVDRGQYYMISPQLYVPRSGKGDELRLGQRSTELAGLEVSNDVRFLYENKGKGGEKDPHISELRQAYAERDHAELRRSVVEHIREQMEEAFNAYQAVAERLEGDKRGLFRRGGEQTLTSEQFEALFAKKDKEWQQNGVYDYMVEKLIKDGLRHTLVATPNVELDEERLVGLAEAFGKDQPYETYIYDDMYRRGRYSATELSGPFGSGSVRLSLIPSNYDSDFGEQSAELQKQMLAEKRKEQPGLNLRVPSLLDAVSYWYRLRAGKANLTGSDVLDQTYIRHFDLDPIHSVGWSRVPRSFVYGYGEPELDRAGAGYRGGARVAVG